MTQNDEPGPLGPAPASPDELHAFVTMALNVKAPRVAITAGHAAPFDYLVHAFFEGRVPRMGPADCVVWASRGGGKTFLGAVATALDLAFKRGITIRILAGSLEQAGRMHQHLRNLFALDALSPLVDGRITDRRLRVVGGGSVELLAQSQASVRGTRVQKLRCDEVELFDPDVWEAAQLTTRSMRCGQIEVRGAIECLSTMHVPGGLMDRLVREGVSAEGEVRRRVFKWGVMDVLESCAEHPACDPSRVSDTCALRPDCDGRARQRSKEECGHVSVDDVLSMRGRVSLATWESEMLCKKPRRTDTVFPEFDASTHVVDDLPPRAWCADAFGGAWIAGMDFGFRSPMAWLWAYLDETGVLWVAAERVVSGVPLPAHLEAIESSPWPRPTWIGIDPAGESRNVQTGRSDASVLREAGWTVRVTRSPLAQGLEMIRARLKPTAHDPPRIFIHRRCASLIASLERYRYAHDHSENREPVKDGADHAVDALRYMVTNLDRAGGVRLARYVA